ncbi:hypothetical protein B0H34DRAFT_793205 [Crassisporium funariophilum]|nr:hypothetical protein B0H34DRAFT_793205 [Crassisporium funariophilum]
MAQQQQKVQDFQGQTFVQETNNHDLQSNYPLVRLDVDVITDSIASRLASSLLGHVLFLKNQIPFPVLQLGRLPAGKANSRATKLRGELLASYDTLTSHLDTTFTALSTALARCSSESGTNLTQAYLAILVGPSVGSAKSKVLLGIDGFEKRIWGSRGDVYEYAEVKGKKTENETNDDFEHEEDSDQSDEEPEESEEEDEDEDSEDDQEDEEENSPSSPTPYLSHAEQQKFLQNADRLLSRTLAAADADGIGIVSEMSPTQTYLLICAPRRFSHPAWIPRQNVSASLDSALNEFLKGSRVATLNVDTSPLDSYSSKTKKNPVEGVWITSREGVRTRLAQNDTNMRHKPLNDHEGDEMIWWSWDGKLMGFSDL